MIPLTSHWSVAKERKRKRPVEDFNDTKPIPGMKLALWFEKRRG